MSTDEIDPEIVETMLQEAEKLRKKYLSDLENGNTDEVINTLFAEDSPYIARKMMFRWRAEKRYDELIDYIHYYYSYEGGYDLWSQVLLDLEMDKDEEKLFKLLRVLLSGRIETYEETLKRLKKSKPSEAYYYKVCLVACIGEIMEFYWQYVFILENKYEDQKDKKHIERIKKEISRFIDIEHCT